jgi:hypothetical protein
VNDTSWRKLSAALGVACVVLIIAAGALLATSGESPTSSQSPSSEISANPSGTDSGPSGSPAPTPSTGTSPIPSNGPTPTLPPNAPIASVTFNNLALDGSSDPLGKSRTFTFVTDGSGPVGIAITKSAPAKATTRICAKVDDSKPDCRLGTRVTYKGAFTDTAHSVWVITLIGPAATGPTVDVAFSWPTFHTKITFTHGRLQGSSSPNVPVTENGFTASFKTVSAGPVTVAASWTVVTANVKVTTEDLNSSSASTLDEKQFTSATNLGTPGYSFNVAAGKSFRVSLRNTSADSGRPDLTAVLSLP